MFRLSSLDVNIPQIAANSGSIAVAVLAVLLSRALEERDDARREGLRAERAMLTSLYIDGCLLSTCTANW